MAGKSKAELAEYGKNTRFNGSRAAEAGRKSAETRVQIGRLKHAAEEVITPEKAREIIEALGGPVSPYKRREERRVKCIGFRARLKPADAQRVKNEMTRRGVTAQQLVEALLLAWADWSEKEPSTVGKTAGGSGDGIKADSTPKDNTKGGKTQ